MPTEHEPWVPNTFTRVNGQKIAIVGYSHHREPQHEDRPNFTKWIVQRVIDGEQNGDSFFGPVSRYFGFENKADFWPGVLSFNFIPECIGVTEEKYDNGTPDQIERAKARVLRILSEHKPDKVFVFTTKGWRDFPPTDQERAGHPCTPLIDGHKDPSWGDYTFGDHRVRACGLRHPQGASIDEMKEQVQAFLNLKDKACSDHLDYRNRNEPVYPSAKSGGSPHAFPATPLLSPARPRRTPCGALHRAVRPRRI